MKRDRRSIRLKGYDYSRSGHYFVTVCTYQRQCFFGEIIEGEVQLNNLGQIVAEEWQKSADIRQEIQLDLWVIMPNHMHGIAIIDSENPHPIIQSENQTTQTGIIKPMKPRSLSSLMAGFKSATTKKINQFRSAPGTPVWQRNYYEHRIRNEESLQKIRQYICTNPQQWKSDQLHPQNPSKW
ncbi:transposase [Roseofilum capinflatum]|uniref:Transposase n=1 Tax=Roseofilum capinflatum BLCC-M114 TaxID=3022440 RepID=A0ABT7B0B4_9CYAN|nr:transposase [Roseofilum capinflatum]MDJ1172571.1 transposase [Roseofilum capinflatum BLCC-M114]